MSKIYTPLISFITFCFLSLHAASQVSTMYTFSQTSGTYVENSDPGRVVLGSTATDDQVFNNNTAGAAAPQTNTGFAIGFNFTYNGIVYDKFAVSANGWMVLGTASFQIGGSGNYTPLSLAGPAGYVSTIAGLARDLQSQAGAELSYQTLGTAPNRILVVQWKTYRRFGGTGQNYNFQIRLNETSNSVQVVYGTFTESTATLGVPQVGLRGTTNVDFNNRTGAWASSTAGAVNTASMTFNNAAGGTPVSGLTYSWAPLTGPNIISAGATIGAESCPPSNSVIDPGETVTVSFCIQNNGAGPTVNLVGTLLATGGVTAPGGPQNYGVVTVGGPVVCRNFSFTASGACGSTITASIQFQDGATNLGTITYTFTLGVQNITFTQNFDAVTAPALPAGWITTTSGVAGILWVTSSAGTPAPPADSAPNSAYVPNNANVGDNRLETPSIPISTGSAQLVFRNNYDMENNFDGGVLEIAIGAGAFQDILTAGGTFVSGGYNGTISAAFGNPLGGRQAWTNVSTGFITTRVNLPASAAGQSIKLRFRQGTDNSIADVGWRVDNIQIIDGYICCSFAPCDQNFDGVAAPALPQSWAAVTGATCGTSAPWVTSSASSVSAPNAAFTNNPNCVSDEYLESPSFRVTSAAASVTFSNSYNLENGFDGMVLEISVNGGAYQDILTAGGSFVVGGYNGTISPSFGSPIAGRPAWTGNSGGFITTTVNLPASANGQVARLRWRRATDTSVSGVGVYIDDISYTNTNCACALVCPSNIVVPVDPNQCGAVVSFALPATIGICGTVTTSPASGSFFPKGITIVTATSGAATCTFTVTVNDNQPPVVTCPANITVGNTTGQCGANVTYTIIVSDNCPGVTVVSSPASGSFFPVGTTTVSSTATDAVGNVSTCNFTITVNDTQPPTITCPANITVNNTSGQCTGVANYSLPSTSDNCGSGIVSDFSQTWTQTGQRGVFFDITNIGSTPVTITALNPAMWAAGPLSNVFTVYFTTSASTWNGNQANAASWTLNTNANVNFPGGTNPVQVSIPLTTGVVLAPGQSKGVYVVGSTGFGGGPVAYLSTAGAPAYTGPQSYQDGNIRFTGGIGSGDLFATFFGTGAPTNFRLYYGSVTYSSPVPTAQIAGLPSGSNFPVGTTTNTFRATDAAGNTSTCSFTVTVVDNQAPVITCPANITATTPIGSCTAVVTYNVTATDNCPGVTTTLVSGPASGSAFPLGPTIVTWRATDAANNTTTCSFTITVLDGQLPVITTQPANVSACLNSNATFTVIATNAVSYQWQTYNGTTWVNIAGATSATLPINNVTMTMATNTYRVIVNGLCTTITSGQASLSIRTLPVISLSTSRSPVLIPGQYVNITAAPGTPGGTIAWYRNGVLMPFEVSLALSNLSVDNTGTYHAVYTAPNGCTVTSASVTVSVATSDNLFVSPNPSNGNFQVRIYAPNQPLVLTVYDGKGSKVYQRSVTTGSTPYSRVDVMLPSVAAGPYVLDVRDASGKQIGKKQIIIWR